MSDETQVIALLIIIVLAGLYLIWIMVGKPKLNKKNVIYALKNFWDRGTKKPIQRIGFIVLCIGIFSFIAWDIEDTAFRLSLYYGFDWEYRFPQKHDSWFYHLHVYLIPLGLFLTWLYPFTRKLRLWIFENR
ncbi:TPA: hypothetical protein PKT77_003518 [Acinetobacter baumannii]|uniref:hypothetical protein n=1 Tax=Acinetobacter baumannii TaxID=470 RepID=UPI0012390E13|nr:hypothetical protein [Acinetobacter baumannii]MBP4676436.1 hypothetical protein [Acinetobacter baumannii]MDA4972137.1 hypothetical protein [Acinetobacter baumannii]MDT1909625.1 hypothetical protein [Acinetobacter baumannii]QER74751.1 hypothetical protein F3P16_06140 [Acinetobacter baumannii]HDI2525668.1 hypothetical protein [Acinetobacter baumannii]